MQGINIEVEISGSEKVAAEGEGVVFQCSRARVMTDMKSDRFVWLLSMAMLELAVDGNTIP